MEMKINHLLVFRERAYIPFNIKRVIQHFQFLLFHTYWSALTAITKHHKLDDLNNGNSFLTVLQAEKFKIKVLAYSVSGESSPPGLQIVAFLLRPHMAWIERVNFLVSLLLRILILLGQVPTLMTSFNFNSFYKCLIANIITLGFRALISKFRRATVCSITPYQITTMKFFHFVSPDF